MRTMKAVHDETCSVAACAEIIGAKWTALLVHDLSEGPRRFSELEHSCAGISPRTLSERLRALEDEGIVARHSYAESPPRVEYELNRRRLGIDEPWGRGREPRDLELCALRGGLAQQPLDLRCDLLGILARREPDREVRVRLHRQHGLLEVRGTAVDPIHVDS